MACSILSALEYLRSVRVPLVGRLKSLPVIVENLYQKKVFNEEEVSEIQAETADSDKTRKILDFVINKGEEACYELLKVIYITRKRTLERPNAQPEQVDLTSPQNSNFDLHYLISCFSFTVDTEMDMTYLKGPKPCYRYQAKLKSKAKNISDGFWTQSKKVLSTNKNPYLSYTSLLLDTQGDISLSKIKKIKSTKSKKIHPKKLKAHMPADKQGVSPSELLKTDEKNILLVGEPGIGKTAVTQQMLKLWAESDNKELDYMFYFDMRETSQITSAMSLEDLLFSVFREAGEDKEDVLEDIKRSSESVTIILDGITDLSCSSVVRGLVEKDLLPDAKIVITCRPEVESEDFLLDWASLRVEVKGFSEQSIKAYLSKMLNAEHFSNILNNLELFTLCHVPMHALMVAACFPFKTSEDSQQPSTMTEIYGNILRHCVQKHTGKTKKHTNHYISKKCEEILPLAEAAFLATQRKSVNLTALHCEDSCVRFSFLKKPEVRVAPTELRTSCAFRHYTMQEFLAGLWLLKNPEQTAGFVQQCLTEGMKHMKHLVPFMCGLLNDRNLDMLKYLIPAQQLKDTSQRFFREMLDTFIPCLLNQDHSDTKDCGLDISILFLCQCLYESQSSEACLYLLDKLDYCLDLSGESLDPYHWCAVSYVISQSKDKKIRLKLEDVMVSEQGLRLLFGCLKNIKWYGCDYLQQQLWTVLLLSEGQMDYVSFLALSGNELHLPVQGNIQLFEKAAQVMQGSPERVNIRIHWDRETPVCQALMSSLFVAFPCIDMLSIVPQWSKLSEQVKSSGNLCRAAEREQQIRDKMLELLSLILSVPYNRTVSYTDEIHKEISLRNLCLQTDLFWGGTLAFAMEDVFSMSRCWHRKWDLILDLYSHVKDYETQTGRSVLPALQPVYQSAPAVWSINLSERKASLLLEVLQLQSEKKPVELTGWSDEESEVWSFLQCLPYMSQLSFEMCLNRSDQAMFLGNLFCRAAEREQQTGEKILELLSSVCSYKTFPIESFCNLKDRDYQCDFLLDLYSHVKDYETQTGRSVLPALQPVYQSAPAVWSINLSERKASFLLEVLKLQSGKKPVELTGWSDEECEMWSFLQCLPYMSELRFSVPCNKTESCRSQRKEKRFLLNLCLQAALHERENIEQTIEDVYLLDSYWDSKWDLILDLYSHLKDYETQTGRSVLPALQPVYQSAPAVWSISLFGRKASILLEVLKVQSEKKPVDLVYWSDEESEVWSFLQCLPYMSQLSFEIHSNWSQEVKFLGNLFCRAAEREQQTGEKILELLSSVCSYKTFPIRDLFYDSYQNYQHCYFLLDLYSHVKDYETQTGRSVLPALQPVYQSVPAFWSIDLSERKASLLLEVLKLQSEKKIVELRGWSDEESEVWSFLQCLPYIFLLKFDLYFKIESCADLRQVNLRKEETFLLNLCLQAALHERETIEQTIEDVFSLFYCWESKWHFLLDLYSHVKDYETRTGRSVLPALQPVYQSAPAFWSVDLSDRKASILLEVLKLQSEKKPVELTGWSDEESTVWSFLQCLPYVSQLSFEIWLNCSAHAKSLGNLFCRAAEREQQTGEKILELLSSVCSYKTFPMNGTEDDNEDDFDSQTKFQCDFLLDLYSHVKDYETQTGRSVLPALQPVYQSAPAVWSINLSERKASLLLEVLKLQSGKKPVELTGCSDEESEVWSFLQCLPYVSQFSCNFRLWLDHSAQAQFLGNLFCRAAEREQQTGEKILELLSSVCSYKTFPVRGLFYDAEDNYGNCYFLLELYSHVKDYETQTGRSVLPALQPVYQSAPADWIINLSGRKAPILLEVLKLQTGKKTVELAGWSDEESEVLSFLHCLPYMSQLSYDFRLWLDHSAQAKFLGNLFCRAAEREQQTGEKILELLSSVCSYEGFPVRDLFYDSYENYQHCNFLLDLYSHVKNYETQTGRSVLPALQPVYQSAPAVWSINLSQASLLLEVLKLQTGKKSVELTDWSDEECVLTFLKCLPYISVLRCDEGFFQFVCSSVFVRSREQFQQLASLLQLMGFTLALTGALPRKTCWSVGRVLGLCGSSVDLILRPSKISLKGASVLFRHTSQLRSLRLSESMALLLCRMVKAQRVARPVSIEELTLVLKMSSERVLLRAVSSVASLLRYWKIKCLDLTEFDVPVHYFMTLLLHHKPLTIKLCAQHVQQLAVLTQEVQDWDLTQGFLSKVGGDLTSCSLDWELLHYLLQQSSNQSITVDLRKSRISEKRIPDLLPFLHRILFKRPSPSFVLSAMRETYKIHASHCIPSLLRSLDHTINLTCRELDTVDCAALLFTLKHGDRVKLNLLWTSIPPGEIQSLLFTLDNVSHLNVDRNLLLRLLRCCSASEAQQGAAAGLLRALQHRLDLSCSSCVMLSEQGQVETLCLTAGDCRVISTLLRHSSQDTLLNLQDCEVEDSGLELLFPVLDKVRLSKALLFQLVSLVPVGSERDTVRRAESLCRALGGELDLSETPLDARTCAALIRILEYSDGLTELDLSHCQLTDQILHSLIPHLHKAQVLDLSHNKITDALTDRLVQLVSINTSIHTVRVFNNSIMDKTPFMNDRRFEMW